ncbi:MAG: alkaline phosphatase D family protein [Bacteroidota bacterium]
MHLRSLSVLVLVLLTAAPLVHAQDTLLQSGPMLGYSTHREVAVWVQTTQPADVQVRYRPEGATADFEVSEVVRADGDSWLTAHVVLFGLEPGTRYAYDVLLDGEVVARPYPTVFQTQTLWQWRTDPPEFTIAFGSCAYVNDPPFDRPGNGYGGDYQIYESIAAQQPDAMLWLGDNVYLREVDWWSERGIDYRYSHTRALPEMQPLLAATHHFATWDDHEFGPNNSDRSYVLKGETLDAFKRYWANPTYGLPETPGVFGHFEWGDVEFFLLDNRYHRSPSDAPRTPDKTMLGDAQEQWLIDALTASRAPFKVVVSGGQVLSRFQLFENWATFPHARQRLLDAIDERGIEGVVFLSGDRHHGELIRIDRPGRYPLFDFTSSPLTAGASSARFEQENPDRVPGTFVTQRHFGTLSLSGPRTDRVMELNAYDVDGALLWSHTIRARDLRNGDE